MPFNNTFTDPEDEKLIKDALRDKEKFGLIYSKYYSQVKNFVRSRYSTKEENIEDLTSVVFLKAFQALGTFRWEGIPIRAWLLRIARNQIIDSFRSSKDALKDPIEHVELKSLEKTPEETVLTEEFEDRIKKILEGLPERERSIIYMKFFEGYANKTISNLLNLSETNVSTIIFRVMQKLRSESNQLR